MHMLLMTMTMIENAFLNGDYIAHRTIFQQQMVVLVVLVVLVMFPTN